MKPADAVTEDTLIGSVIESQSHQLFSRRHAGAADAMTVMQHVNAADDMVGCNFGAESQQQQQRQEC